MRLFTKLWTTLLLLCVAGVVNAAKEYEVDQKYTGLADLVTSGQLFSIVNETDAKGLCFGFGDAEQNMYYETYADMASSKSYTFKLENAVGDDVAGYYYLRPYKPDGTLNNVWGWGGYFNSQPVDGWCDFCLGLNNQNGQDLKNGAVWAIEASDGKFALKNVGTGKYLKDAAPAKYDAATYFTFCTLKEKVSTDPLAEQKDALEAAIAKGKMYNAIAYTEATFAAVGTAVSAGETALAATDATAESLTDATKAITDAIAALALKDGYSDLTAANFFEWDSATAPTTSKATGCDFNLFTATGMVYGNSSVALLTFADLSAYDKLVVAAASGTPRILLNRDVNEGQWSETEAESHLIDNTKGGWSAKYFTTENGVTTVDLKQLVADKGFAHLHSIKGSGNVTVSGLYLYKEAVAGDVLPIDIQFGANYNDKSVSSYTTTWTATKDGKTWTLTNFNNNSNNWSSVKCGRSGNASVASIASPAIDAAVKNYVITLVAASNVNSAKLTIMNGEDKVGEDIDITENFVKGEVVVPVEGQKGYSYVLTIDNASASKNGSVEISKITLADKIQEPVHIANTAETAYTVAKAIELIDAGEALSDSVYVKGIVSKVDGFNETYKSITYWISEDGKTEGQQFECYGGKGIKGVDFASIDDVEVGAEVIVVGLLAKYGTTYELKADNQLVSYKAPVKPQFANGVYYIKNVASGLYLTGANDWGTRGSVGNDGAPFELTMLEGGGYSIKHTLVTASNKFLGSNLYTDSTTPDGGFIFTKNEDGSFTIGLGKKYLAQGAATSTSNDFVLVEANEVTDSAKWLVLTKEQAVAALENATVEAPLTATFLIKNPGFNRNVSLDGWTMEAGNKNLSGGEDGNRCAESWQSAFVLSQKLDVPNGKYILTAQAALTDYTDAYDGVEYPVVYANDKSAPFKSMEGDDIKSNMNKLSASFTAKKYIVTVDTVTVVDGQLTIGVKGTRTNTWCIWDNFDLTYLGNAIDLSEIIASYNAALAAARLALAAEENAIVTGEERTALTKAIADNEVVLETQEALTAAITALNTATTAFTSAKLSYQELLTTKTDVAAYSFKYASADKKAAAEASVDATATNAADAKAKAAAILKAYRQYAESSALAEGVEGAKNMTDSIKNADSNDGVNNWTTKLGEGSGGKISILSNEPFTDGSDNATHNYFDGGNWGANAWDVALEQKIALPAGKYQLTVTARAERAVDFKLYAGKDSVALTTISSVGGLFNRGWNDGAVEFEMAKSDSIIIGVRGATSEVHNWMSFTRFRLVQLEAIEEPHNQIIPTDVAEPTYSYPASWDFTNWSAATVTNLKADAAWSIFNGWSDVEKDPAKSGNPQEPTEATKDNCFWHQGITDAYGQLYANGKLIEETKGLKFTEAYAATRGLAIAVNYPSTSLGTYAGAQYLWLGGGGKSVPCFVLPQVPAGMQITAVVESHKSTDGRGIELYAGSLDAANKIGDSFKPTTQDTHTWTIAEAGDIVIYNTSGCHIYSIVVEKASGISLVNADKLNGEVYNLNGQKMNKTQKGLYIVNGKKVVLK